MSPGRTRGESVEEAVFKTSITMVKLKTMSEISPPIIELRIRRESSMLVTKSGSAISPSRMLKFVSSKARIAKKNTKKIKEIKAGRKAMLLTVF
jgi:hypothetical protein